MMLTSTVSGFLATYHTFRSFLPNKVSQSSILMMFDINDEDHVLNLKSKGSLDPWMCLIIRTLEDYVPNILFKLFAYFARFLFRYLLLRDSRYSSSAMDGHDNIDIISFDDSDFNFNISNHDQEDVIVYLHGGGYNICDNTDLMMIDELLPRLATHLKSINNRKYSRMKLLPRIYTIRYETLFAPIIKLPFGLHEKIFGNSAQPPIHRIHRQVLESFDAIENNGERRVIAIMGDSAGGNAALSLSLALQKRSTLFKPALCLLSPWLDIFSPPNANGNVDEEKFKSHRNIKYDMLSINFLNRCRQACVNYRANCSSDLDKAAGKAERVGRYLVECGVKVVAFDMDLCIVNQHSRGSLKRYSINEFCKKVKYDFIVAARAFHRLGIKLSIATHSDACEYGYFRPETNYIIGDALVKEVLASSVPEIADDFFIVAYNPSSRGNRDVRDGYKKRHIREIATHYNVARAEIVLVDDDARNCANTNDEFTAYQVDPDTGFDINSFADAIGARRPLCESLQTGLIGGNIRNVRSGHAYVNADTNLPLSLVASPGEANDHQLELLPPTLVIAGERELFFDDIKKFVDKARTAQTKYFEDTLNDNEQQTSPHNNTHMTQINSIRNIEFLIGDGEIHCYPMIGLHPKRDIFERFGCGWVHELLFRGRYYYSKMGDTTTTNAKNNYTTPVKGKVVAPQYAALQSEKSGASMQALAALDSISLFLVDAAIRASSYDASPLKASNIEITNINVTGDPEMVPENALHFFSNEIKLNLPSEDDVLSPQLDGESSKPSDSVDCSVEMIFVDEVEENDKLLELSESNAIFNTEVTTINMSVLSESSQSVTQIDWLLPESSIANHTDIVSPMRVGEGIQRIGNTRDSSLSNISLDGQGVLDFGTSDSSDSDH